jgi:sugar phosphate isomerase/epimerase
MGGLGTSAVQMIETLSDRLEAIHLHDNDLLRDKHAIPFTYNVDFAPIIEAMKKVNYQGDITLESETFARKAPVELLPSVAKYSASVAEYFRNQVQKK